MSARAARIEAVAIDVGAHGTRVAVRDRDGRVEPVAELPGGTGAADALDALVGRTPVPSLVLLTPAAADPTAVAVHVAALAGRAGEVRAVPVPVAVLAADGTVRDPCLVVHAGPSGTELAVVRSGAVVSVEHVPVGGLEALAGDMVRRHGVGEVLLAGRDAVLATALDRATAGSGCVVRTVTEPGTAAVRGGLRCVDAPAGRPGAGPSPEPGPSAVPGRRRVLPALVAALGMVLLGAGAVLGRSDPQAVAGSALVQYGYATDLPAGWEHTGSDATRRRTLLTPSGAPDGVELVSVERNPLGYDSGLEPGRARADLERTFAGAAAVEGLDGLRADVVAGRRVLRYRQQRAGSSVDWFVLFTGADEVAVGCRRPVSGPSPALDAACAAVVGSVRVVG